MSPRARFTKSGAVWHDEVSDERLIEDDLAEMLASLPDGTVLRVVVPGTAEDEEDDEEES